MVEGSARLTVEVSSVHHAREAQPDLILVDETQPGLSGWDTAAQLAERVCSAWNAQGGGDAVALESGIPPRETASS